MVAADDADDDADEEDEDKNEEMEDAEDEAGEEVRVLNRKPRRNFICCVRVSGTVQGQSAESSASTPSAKSEERSS